MEASTSPEPDLLARCYLTSASPEGLTAVVDGKSEIRSWSSITAAAATIVEHVGSNIFVLAVEFDDGRTFVTGEVEPAWASIIEQIHFRVPGVEAFSTWGPGLIENPGVVNLFGQ
jgi:hypothetical protein